MAGERKPYVFVGTEREVVDPARYERAMRAWTDYLLRHLAARRLREREQQTNEPA